MNVRLCVWCGHRQRLGICDICWIELKKWAMKEDR